jgi:hypothetical protein
MSSELQVVVVPDQARLLASQDIAFVPNQSLSKTIRDHIKTVEKLKGAVARERFYEILRNTVSPAVAALVNQATRAGWLEELRIGARDVKEVTDSLGNTRSELQKFTVVHFKPKAAEAKQVTQTQYEMMVTTLTKLGVPEDKMDETIKSMGYQLRKPKVREVASEAVAQPQLTEPASV